MGVFDGFHLFLLDLEITFNSEKEAAFFAECFFVVVVVVFIPCSLCIFITPFWGGFSSV